MLDYCKVIMRADYESIQRCLAPRRSLASRWWEPRVWKACRDLALCSLRFSCPPSQAFFKLFLSCYHTKYQALELSQSNEGDWEEYKYCTLG